LLVKVLVCVYVCMYVSMFMRSGELAETENGAGEGRSARVDGARFDVMIAEVATGGDRVPVSRDDGDGTGDSGFEGKRSEGKEGQ